MATTDIPSLTRIVDGTEIPAAGTYVLDPAHTMVEFQARHLGLSKVKGRFGAVSGEVVIGDDPIESTSDVVIEAASIDTRNVDRDAHLRSADFLDTDVHPHLVFTTAGVRHSDSGWKLDGQLTIRGITNAVTLDVDFDGAALDTENTARIAFTATTEIDREDFGLTWNQVLETGGLLVGKTVAISLDVQAVAATS